MRFYISDMLRIAAVLLPAYLIIRIILCISFKIKRNLPREILLGVFVLFVSGLLVMLFGGDISRFAPARMWETAASRVVSGNAINLVPLDTVRRFWSNPGSNGFMINIVGNYVMFIPIGMFMPLLWKRWQRFAIMLAAAVLMPVLIESFQLFIGRSVDIDDVLLNALGILSGYLIWLLLKKISPKLQAVSV